MKNFSVFFEILSRELPAARLEIEWIETEGMMRGIEGDTRKVEKYDHHYAVSVVLKLLAFKLQTLFLRKRKNDTQ